MKKPWFKSKTFWMGFANIALNVLPLCGIPIPHAAVYTTGALLGGGIAGNRMMKDGLPERKETVTDIQATREED